MNIQQKRPDQRLVGNKLVTAKHKSLPLYLLISFILCISIFFSCETKPSTLFDSIKVTQISSIVNDAYSLAFSIKPSTRQDTSQEFTFALFKGTPSVTSTLQVKNAEARFTRNIGGKYAFVNLLFAFADDGDGAASNIMEPPQEQKDLGRTAFEAPLESISEYTLYITNNQQFRKIDTYMTGQWQPEAAKTPTLLVPTFDLIDISIRADELFVLPAVYQNYQDANIQSRLDIFFIGLEKGNTILIRFDKNGGFTVGDAPVNGKRVTLSTVVGNSGEQIAEEIILTAFSLTQSQFENELSSFVLGNSFNTVGADLNHYLRRVFFRFDK